VEHGLDLDDLVGPRLSRIAHIRAELASGRLDPSLRWTVPPPIVDADPLGEESCRA
jgi:hypothetical protein